MNSRLEKYTVHQPINLCKSIHLAVEWEITLIKRMSNFTAGRFFVFWMISSEGSSEHRHLTWTFIAYQRNHSATGRVLGMKFTRPNVFSDTPSVELPWNLFTRPRKILSKYLYEISEAVYKQRKFATSHRSSELFSYVFIIFTILIKRNSKLIFINSNEI